MVGKGNTCGYWRFQEGRTFLHSEGGIGVLAKDYATKVMERTETEGLEDVLDERADIHFGG